jgi:hypothetical protein
MGVGVSQKKIFTTLRMILLQKFQPTLEISLFGVAIPPLA